MTVTLWGRSMLPTIWPGSPVIVERCQPSALRFGDVVVARRGTTLVAHRLVSGRPGAWVCQGDFHDAVDAPLHDDEILGRLAHAYFGRWRVPFPAAPVNRALLAVVPLARALRAPATAVFRSGYQGIVRSRVTTRARRRLQEFEVVRCGPEHIDGVRRALLRRSVRPTAEALSAFDAPSDGQSLRFGVVALDRSGGVAGFVKVAQTAQGLGIFDLWTRHLYRGLGVSTAIVGFAVQELERAIADANSDDEVFADVRIERGAAYHAFARAGFVERLDLASPSPHHLRMTRSLRSQSL